MSVLLREGFFGTQNMYYFSPNFNKTFHICSYIAWEVFSIIFFIYIYIYATTDGPKSPKRKKKENSPSSHILIYWLILANDSLKFLSWQDLKRRYIYLYIYSRVKATKANIASNFYTIYETSSANRSILYQNVLWRHRHVVLI